MLDRIIHLLIKVWERILLRGFFIAAILALIAGIFLEKIHTPVWVYALIFVILLTLIIFGDRWFIQIYRKLTGDPSFLIDYIDYSQLIQNRSVRANVKFINKRGSKQIKHIDIIVKYTSEIARVSLKENKVIKGNETITIPIPLSITSPNFINDAVGASTQRLQLSLSFSLEWLIRPIIYRIPIPENITYSGTKYYDKCPSFVL